jgi:hypothetical protein
MIVFVAGMSRAGSMWTYNVVRALFEAEGWSVLPREYPQDVSGIVRSAFFSEEKEKEVYCIKTHHLLKNSLPTKHDVKVICNVRDVRDACLSYMRFMHADYEAGKDAMISMMNATDHYLSTFQNKILSVRFEDLIHTPMNVLENISAFLKINLSESRKMEILQKFDKSNIQNKLRDMSTLEINENVEVKDAELRSRFDVLENLDGTYRVIDKTTGFQSGHITSIADGEWKTYFDRSQADQLISLSKEWLLKYGYKV